MKIIIFFLLEEKLLEKFLDDFMNASKMRTCYVRRACAYACFTCYINIPFYPTRLIYTEDRSNVTTVCIWDAVLRFFYHLAFIIELLLWLFITVSSFIRDNLVIIIFFFQFFSREFSPLLGNKKDG